MTPIAEGVHSAIWALEVPIPQEWLLLYKVALSRYLSQSAGCNLIPFQPRDLHLARKTIDHNPAAADNQLLDATL